MANVRTLKVTARQAAFAVVGSGTATISAYDMVHSRQTLDVANAIFTISDIAYDVNNAANITRGGNLIFACSAGQNELNLTDSIGVVLNDKASSNVTVNLGASEGTIIIQFSKGEGFNDPDRQNQGPGSL
jgi:hypothetical protein